MQEENTEKTAVKATNAVRGDWMDTGEEFKIPLDVARVEFMRFVRGMALDFDDENVDENDRRDRYKDIATALRAIRRGYLVVHATGELEYTPQGAGIDGTITFYEPTGASLMAMDLKKKTADVGKMFALLADMTRQSAKTYARMQNRDITLCLAIATLFLN